MGGGMGSGRSLYLTLRLPSCVNGACHSEQRVSATWPVRSPQRDARPCKRPTLRFCVFCGRAKCNAAATGTPDRPLEPVCQPLVTTLVSGLISFRTRCPTFNRQRWGKKKKKLFDTSCICNVPNPFFFRAATDNIYSCELPSSSELDYMK